MGERGPRPDRALTAAGLPRGGLFAALALGLAACGAVGSAERSTMPAEARADRPPASGAAPARPPAFDPAPRDVAREFALAALRREVEALAAGTGGTVGVAAIDPVSGETVAVRGDRPFPMLSVYKLPVAVEVLTRVERGGIALDDTVRLHPSDLRIGRDVVSPRIGPGGSVFTVGELLDLALVESDNASADALLGLVGGPAVVTARMRALGIEGIRVDRSEGELILDYYGVDERRPPEEWSLPVLRRGIATVGPEWRAWAAARFSADPRDTATPEAAVDLLVKIRRGEVLGPEATGLLLDLLRRTASGPDRIRSLLPPDVAVAHRTGTGGSTGGVVSAVNDIGLIERPDGSAIALAVFVQDAPGPIPEVERAIARIARAVHDFWGPPTPARSSRAARRPYSRPW